MLTACGGQSSSLSSEGSNITDLSHVSSQPEESTTSLVSRASVEDPSLPEVSAEESSLPISSEESSVLTSDDASSKGGFSSKGTTSSEEESLSEESLVSSEEVSSEASTEETYEPSSEASSEEFSSEDTLSSEELPSSSESASGTTIPTPEYDERWNLDFNTYGETFRNKLAGLILASGKVASYDAQKTIGPKAAAYPNDDSDTFIPFYHEAKDGEQVTYDVCNREHTWPDSRGGGSFENDPVMIRPALKSENSDRGNNFYGGGGGAEWDPASCGYKGARGESARIMLYCATAYYTMGVSLSNNPNDGAAKKTMGTLKTLLKWNREYQPTEFEKKINDRLDKMGYRRNPFVDHPEYAEWIWDDNGLRTTAFDGTIVTPNPEDEVWYNQVTDFSNLDGNSYIIATSLNSNYFALTPTAKADNLPWYILGDSCLYSDGKLSSPSELSWFRFDEVGEDTYTITASTGKTLYGYVAGTHYSIGWADDIDEIAQQQNGTTPNPISNEWKITAASDGGFKLTTANVYLEYYNGSWCGYRNAPSDPIMLFQA